MIFHVFMNTPIEQVRQLFINWLNYANLKRTSFEVRGCVWTIVLYTQSSEKNIFTFPEQYHRVFTMIFVNCTDRSSCCVWDCVCARGQRLIGQSGDVDRANPPLSFYRSQEAPLRAGRLQSCRAADWDRTESSIDVHEAPSYRVPSFSLAVFLVCRICCRQWSGEVKVEWAKPAGPLCSSGNGSDIPANRKRYSASRCFPLKMQMNVCACHHILALCVCVCVNRRRHVCDSLQPADGGCWSVLIISLHLLSLVMSWWW